MDNQDSKSIIAIFIVLFISMILAIAGSDGSAILFGTIPLFGFGIVIIFFIQWIAFIPSYIKRTEKFFDLTGSFTYCTVVLISVLFSSEADPRSLLLMVLVLIWALRLGLFLFRRVIKAGEDKRFESIKQSFFQFLMTWTLQGLWVSFTLAAALAAITTDKKESLGIVGIVGFIIWILGFGFEVIADYQKSKFRSIPENQGKFITTGLWRFSRHPNYFGEILLWIGIAVIALPTLEGMRWLTLISPIFVALLLTRVSGIPILEKRADNKWGTQTDYQEYKSKTPALIPRFRSNR
jgi:steroid 5-alpha reductase family enzyme